MPHNDLPSADPSPQAGIWPPPPLSHPIVRPIESAYLPQQRSARVIIILLVCFCLFSLCNALGETLSGPAKQILAGLGMGLCGLVEIVTGVIFLFWTHRAYKNLQAFGLSGLRNSPGWAVGFFLVPIVSLYRPYQVFTELWCGSTPSPQAHSGQEWQSSKVPPLLGWWWAFWIILL